MRQTHRFRHGKFIAAMAGRTKACVAGLERSNSSTPLKMLENKAAFAAITLAIASISLPLHAATGTIQFCKGGLESGADLAGHSTNVTGAPATFTECGTGTASFADGSDASGYLAYLFIVEGANKPPFKCTLSFQTSVNAQGQCSVAAVVTGGNQGHTCSANTTFNSTTCSFSTSVVSN
jgi:hypothetical protein